MKRQKSFFKRALLSLTALLALAQGAKAQEAYAVYNDVSKVVTFYYDNLRASRENTVEINNDFVFSHAYGEAEKAVFDPSFSAYRPTSTAYWFFICHKLNFLKPSGCHFTLTFGQYHSVYIPQAHRS